jgi:transcriptional regulator NrdR family protein
MRCPICKGKLGKVLETRTPEDDGPIMRRRTCVLNHPFWTRETNFRMTAQDKSKSAQAVVSQRNRLIIELLNHKTLSQTEIGEMFNIDRTEVSRLANIHLPQRNNRSEGQLRRWAKKRLALTGELS